MFGKPMKLLEMSAFSGNMDAQERLGDIYTAYEEQGTLSKKRVLAIGMHILAVQQGSETAKGKLDALLKFSCPFTLLS
jgi:hypothetical protein